MSEPTLYAQMKPHADRFIRSYKTDFTECDAAMLKKADPGDERIWALRDTGTWFPLVKGFDKIPEENVEQAMEIALAVLSGTLQGDRHDAFFRVHINRVEKGHAYGTLTQLSRKQAEQEKQKLEELLRQTRLRLHAKKIASQRVSLWGTQTNKALTS